MTPDEVTRIFTAIQEIKDLLIGTYDKRGMISKVESHETWINKQRRSRDGFFNYAYKIIIGIVVSYIAIQIGLK